MRLRLLGLFGLVLCSLVKIPVAVGEANGTDGHGHHGVTLASWRWDEYSDSVGFLLMVLTAGALKIAFHHTPYLLEHFPESCVLIVIGIAIGVFVYYGVESHSHHFPVFTSHLFFNVLLPPIILDSSYSLYDRDFLNNLGSVILFAVVGTLFNIFAIGYALELIYQAGGLGVFPALDTTHCLVFSSLIAAVDPVAVLAIFEQVGVHMGLYNTMVALARQPKIEYTQYILAFFSFFFVVLGGLVIGVLVGALCAFVLKYTRHVRVLEPLVVFATSYLAYVLAETIHWSGIISLIACGIMQKRYAFRNISKKSYTTVKCGVKTLATFSDCIIFLFLGIVTLSHAMEWHTLFVLWTLILCIFVRFVGVFGLSYLINMWRIKKITFKEQLIMAYGGLRGGVGFSLVTILDEEDPFKNIFLTTTLVMIFFTVFIQGGTIKTLVDRLKIRRHVQREMTISKDVHEKMMDHVMAGIESVTGKHSKYTVIEAFHRLDHDYLKRLLIRHDVEHPLAARFRRITVNEHHIRLYGPNVFAYKHTLSMEGVNAKTPALTRAHSAEMDEAQVRALRAVLSNTAFERYRNRSMCTWDTPENVKMELLRAQEERARVIERDMSDDEDDDDDEEELKMLGAARSTSPQPQQPEGGLWMRKSSSAAKIKRQYESTVRARKTSACACPVLVVSEHEGDVTGDEAVQQMLLENGHNGCEEDGEKA